MGEAWRVFEQIRATDRAWTDWRTIILAAATFRY
jgi:hypothetical protein